MVLIEETFQEEDNWTNSYYDSLHDVLTTYRWFIHLQTQSLLSPSQIKNIVYEVMELYFIGETP